MRSLEKTGKTVDEAIWSGLQELKLSRDNVEISIIDVGSKGFLGLGARPAKVLLKEVEPEPIVEAPKAVKPQAVPERRAPQPKERVKVVEENKVEAAVDEERTLPAKRAQHFLHELLQEMEIKSEIRTRFNDGILTINLDGGNELGLLIGKRGVTLDALQYLTSLVANKGEEEHIRVVLNIGDYRRRREETLARLARRLAQQVELRGESVVLEPMSAQERRIIHLTLQDSPKVITYSEGEEPYRKVVIARK
ncbi:MAG: RNA-binding cell elongation regulator Jag/EloR [Bacillota bacterium]